MTTTIELKRAKRTTTGSRVWESRDGRYRIAASEMCFGVKLWPVYYTAWARVIVDDVGRRVAIWKRISRHRKRSAALAACEGFERKRRRAAV